MSQNLWSAADHWPHSHLRPGAIRWVRSSVHYEQTVMFYRDLVGLSVVDEFARSFGEDGTVFGLPDSAVQMEIVRAHGSPNHDAQFDQIVFYLADVDAIAWATRPLREHGLQPQSSFHPYWQANRAVVFLDPDGPRRGLCARDLRVDNAELTSLPTDTPPAAARSSA